MKLGAAPVFSVLHYFLPVLALSIASTAFAQANRVRVTPENISRQPMAFRMSAPWSGKATKTFDVDIHGAHGENLAPRTLKCRASLLVRDRQGEISSCPISAAGRDDVLDYQFSVSDKLLARSEFRFSESNDGSKPIYYFVLADFAEPVKAAQAPLFRLRLAVTAPSGGQAIGPSEIGSLAFTPDGRKLIVFSSGGPVRLVDVASGKVDDDLIASPRGYGCTCFSPGAKLLFCGGAWWDAATLARGKLLPRIMHFPETDVAAISPDGKSLALGSLDISPEDGTAQLFKLYDRATGREKGGLRCLRSRRAGRHLPLQIDAGFLRVFARRKNSCG